MWVDKGVQRMIESGNMTWKLYSESVREFVWWVVSFLPQEFVWWVASFSPQEFVVRGSLSSLKRERYKLETPSFLLKLWLGKRYAFRCLYLRHIIPKTTSPPQHMLNINLLFLRLRLSSLRFCPRYSHDVFTLLTSPVILIQRFFLSVQLFPRFFLSHASQHKTKPLNLIHSINYHPFNATKLSLRTVKLKVTNGREALVQLFPFLVFAYLWSSPKRLRSII